MTATQEEIFVVVNYGESMIELPDEDGMLNTGSISMSATNDYNYLAAFFKINASTFKSFMADTSANKSPLVSR